MGTSVYIRPSGFSTVTAFVPLREKPFSHNVSARTPAGYTCSVTVPNLPRNGKGVAGFASSSGGYAGGGAAWSETAKKVTTRNRFIKKGRLKSAALHSMRKRNLERRIEERTELLRA